MGESGGGAVKSALTVGKMLMGPWSSDSILHLICGEFVDEVEGGWSTLEPATKCKVLVSLCVKPQAPKESLLRLLDTADADLDEWVTITSSLARRWLFSSTLAETPKLQKAVDSTLDGVLSQISQEWKIHFARREGTCSTSKDGDDEVEKRMAEEKSGSSIDVDDDEVAHLFSLQSPYFSSLEHSFVEQGLCHHPRQEKKQYENQDFKPRHDVSESFREELGRTVTYLKPKMEAPAKELQPEEKMKMWMASSHASGSKDGGGIWANSASSIAAQERVLAAPIMASKRGTAGDVSDRPAGNGLGLKPSVSGRTLGRGGGGSRRSKIMILDDAELIQKITQTHESPAAKKAKQSPMQGEKQAEGQAESPKAIGREPLAQEESAAKGEKGAIPLSESAGLGSKAGPPAVTSAATDVPPGTATSAVLSAVDTPALEDSKTPPDPDASKLGHVNPDLEKILEKRNALKEEEKERIELFFQNINPTPEVKHCKITLHEETTELPETNEIQRDTLLITLDYEKMIWQMKRKLKKKKKSASSADTAT